MAKMDAAFADFDRVRCLVERAAARVYGTLDLPPWIEFDDLIQEGFLMACEAVDRWNPQRARFTTYLYPHLDFFLRRGVQRQLPASFEHPLPDEEFEGPVPEVDSIHAIDLQLTLHAMLVRLKEEAPFAWEVLTHFFGLEGRNPKSLPAIERILRLGRGEGKRWLQEGLIRLRQMWREIEQSA